MSFRVARKQVGAWADLFDLLADGLLMDRSFLADAPSSNPLCCLHDGVEAKGVRLATTYACTYQSMQ